SVSPCADLRVRQPEMIPQCGSGILLAVDAAPLELRDHQSHERLEGAGQSGRADDEAVAGPLGEPLFQTIGDSLRAADPGVLQPPPAGGVHEVANGRVMIAAQLEDAVADRVDRTLAESLPGCQAPSPRAQGKRIWKLRGFSVTVVESFTARSLLHDWSTLS